MDIEQNVVNNDVKVYLLASSLADLYNSGAVLKHKISTVGEGGSEPGRLFHLRKAKFYSSSTATVSTKLIPLSE